MSQPPPEYGVAPPLHEMPPPVPAKREANVTLPWTRTVEVPADPASGSVALVVLAGAEGAEAHGRYTIDGTTVREGTASGPYGVLTITGS
jgi:hypothetical protein